MEFHLKSMDLDLMNQFSPAMPPWYAVMLPWGPDRWNAGQNPKDHTTMTQETMLGGNGKMHGEEDESSHHPHGIVSCLDAHLVSLGTVGVGKNHHCPIAMVIRQVRTRRTNTSSNTTLNVLHHTVWNLKIIRHQTIPQAKTTKQTASPTISSQNHHLPTGSTLPGSHQQIFQEIRLTIFQPILVGQPEN